MWKIECYAKDRHQSPCLVYIRNDWFPQRALNASGYLVDCSMQSSRDDELWYVEYSEEHETLQFALKNKASGKYLSIISSSGGMYRVAFQDDPGYWSASLAKYAPSPGQVATIVAVAPIAAVAAATVGGAAGLVIAGAVGWGTQAMMAVGATTSALTAITTTVAPVVMNPASDKWVVDKM